MKYCQKCDTEYETEDECMCRKYRAYCENGQKRRVPKSWKLDWWDGYVNDTWDCKHFNFEDAPDGSAKCLDCGLRAKAPDCDHYEFSTQGDGTAKCDGCGITMPWSK